MAFMIGYLSAMATETEQVKVRMLSHVQEMMDDGEAYGLPAIPSYHVAWLQHLE